MVYTQMFVFVSSIFWPVDVVFLIWKKRKLTFDQGTLISVITITMLNPIFCPNVNKHLSSCGSYHGCRALFICLHRHKSYNFYALLTLCLCCWGLCLLINKLEWTTSKSLSLWICRHSSGLAHGHTLAPHTASADSNTDTTSHFISSEASGARDSLKIDEKSRYSLLLWLYVRNVSWDKLHTFDCAHKREIMQ